MGEVGEEGRADSCRKAKSPTANQWASASKGEFQGCIGGGRGLNAETALSAPTFILKLVMWWSDQRHFDCFQYS